MITSIIFWAIYLLLGWLLALYLSKEGDTLGAFCTWAVMLVWPVIAAIFLVVMVVLGPSELIRKLNK